MGIGLNLNGVHAEHGYVSESERNVGNQNDGAKSQEKNFSELVKLNDYNS